MKTVNWWRWRQCPQCAAEIGQPCADLTGVRADGDTTVEKIMPREKPHSRRQPRTGGKP